MQRTRSQSGIRCFVRFRKFAEDNDVKAGLLINGSRTMLTGQAVGPSMFEVFEVLGQKRSVERLRSGVPWFDAMNALGDV